MSHSIFQAVVVSIPQRVCTWHPYTHFLYMPSFSSAKPSCRREKKRSNRCEEAKKGEAGPRDLRLKHTKCNSSSFFNTYLHHSIPVILFLLLLIFHLFFFSSFWLSLHHAEVPETEVEPTPQQQHCHLLNPLHPCGAPNLNFLLHKK